MCSSSITNNTNFIIRLDFSDIRIDREFSPIIYLKPGETTSYFVPNNTFINVEMLSQSWFTTEFEPYSAVVIRDNKYKYGIVTYFTIDDTCSSYIIRQIFESDI